MKPALARALAERALALGARDISPDAEAVALACLIDIIGVAIAGTERPIAKTAAEFATSMYGAGRATVLATRQGAHPQAAAFANGVAAHALDYDDTSYAGVVHATAVVFPAALAVAEAHQLSGADFLRAFIVGVETTYALGRLFGTAVYDRGWFATGVFGGVGAAAATSILLADDVAQLTRAIVLAAVQASGPRVILGTDTKPWSVGRAALMGYECAHTATQDIGVPNDVFEGRNGLFQLLSGNRHAPRALDDTLGLLDPGIFFKRFPVCSSAQAALTALERLICQTGFGHAEVRSITVELAPLAAESLPYAHPKDTVEAQFSAQFAMACLLVFGKLEAATINEYTLSDESLVTTMSKISTHRGLEDVDTNSYPEAARVTVSLMDGARVAETVTTPYGHPRNPLSAAQLAEKFSSNLAGYAPELVESQLRAIRQAKTLTKISELLMPFRLKP